MTLKIYNSASKKKEVFYPITPGKVNIYVCGMTIYDYCHIGHARSMTIFDVVVRYFRYLGLEVNYVRNITDIDDKIIKRANQNQESTQELTRRFIHAMHQDLDQLGLVRPNREPQATDYIAKMIHVIQTLIDKGYAYVGEGGDVYYDVNKFERYGQLSHRNLDDLIAGARIEVSKDKRSPLDFVLWKVAKPGEPKWESPWGEGRPGWHIECSTMSSDCLANHIDIHGGGMDLLFPHHENEVAQSEAFSGEKFVNYWMHVAYLQIDHKKMSKSLGNFFTIREILEKYPAEIVRYFLLASHYRSPLNFSDEALEQAKIGLQRLYKAIKSAKEVEHLIEKDIWGFQKKRLPHELEQYRNQFVNAMNDDFNTPKAFSVLFDIARDINKHLDSDPGRSQQLSMLLKQFGSVLGVLQQDYEALFFSVPETLSEEEKGKIEQLIRERNDARESKDWAKSDKIRDQLKEMGVELEDTKDGTIWKTV